jgi:hypothetical protein
MSNHMDTDERGGARAPDVFDGTSSKFRLFKQQVKLYIATSGDRFPNDLSKILFALSYIRGGAAGEWAASLAEEYIDRIKSSTWLNFWIMLEARFIDKNAQERARLQLDHLTQGNKTANEYFLEFALLAANAGIDTSKPELFPQLRSIINKNMNGALIDKVYMSDNIPTTMETYAKRIEALDAIWRMREEDRKARNVQRRGPGITRSSETGGYAPGQGPMDVDRNRAKRQVAWTPEQTQLAREGKCFLCKERGHRRPDCPKRTTVSATVNTPANILNRPRLREVSIAEESEGAVTETNEVNEVAEGF